MSRKTKTTNVLIEITFWIFSILFLYPIFMILITSFKSKSEANVLSANLPKEWNFDNYAQVWEQGKIAQSLCNSVFVSLLSVLFIIMFASILSYTLVRRDTKLCKIINRLLTFGIIAPMAILPTIELLKWMKMYGELISLVFLYAALYLPFSTMLYSSFIKTIPRELDEAAVMDGVKGFPLFSKVIFPLLKPITATTAILSFMWVWNDFQYPLYLLNSSTKWTLPLSVFNFYGQYSRSWNLVCADMVIVSIPIVLIYIFAQEYVIAGMTAGAVKG